MKIAYIHLYCISIPLKKSFKHSTHERTSTDNIIIETRLEDGTLGYGEGLPRKYVTGETQESVISVLQQINPRLFQQNFSQIEDLIAFLDSEILNQKNFPYDRANNTARCALELSLLDAYCRYFRKTFFEVAQIVLADKNDLKNVSPIYYDGVISLGSLAQTLWSGLKMKCFGFHKLKIKMGSEVDTILKTLNYLRRVLGSNVDLRIDANEAWTLEKAMILVEKLKRFKISSLEQPLPHSELIKMRELKKASSIPLMLDESLCTLEDARKAIQQELCDSFNIRLSKCGGFIHSLRIAQLARQNGYGYQLGCMVGETGILSAAGRQFASLDPAIRYLEGSYDRYLLKDNVIREEISFGRSGKALALNGYGLGVHVDKERLKRYTIFSTELYK